MSQQPQQPDESVFAPQPIPGKWTVDVVTSTEGVKAVRVIVEDAAGVAVRFLDPATGEQVAAMMRVAAQQAQTGLFVPPLVMGNGHGSTP